VCDMNGRMYRNGAARRQIRRQKNLDFARGELASAALPSALEAGRACGVGPGRFHTTGKAAYSRPAWDRDQANFWPQNQTIDWDVFIEALRELMRTAA
jgi:hypothetical protein